MEQNVFHYSARVYYEDTDAGGVVYHARYLHFFERARTEYLRTFNFSQQELLVENKGAFVVKSMNIDYCFPAKLDDLLQVETLVTEIKGASIIFSQIIKRNELTLCRATVKVAYVDLGKMKPVAIPSQIKATLVN
ncbi:MAG: tol-pal system-associated acyl-CoA thioesterase [Aggregatibacter segnis]|uniref:Tol-pal system-associated acyl-CoA thioesterase n=1 Tax=Aggregatibacter segnis TaxID=739 RepID=A0A8B2U1T6_9PAST|nr:tol-pal system-associated acyl-CoA thioesterase [Aggregatibacter segnis]RDE71630.1 tol-pal system-associated acyl-CoA thioesterase [Aggregatibacter segnis]